MGQTLDKINEEPFFEKIVGLYRKSVIARHVAHTIKRYFLVSDYYLECCAGTGETSNIIPKQGRVLGAIEFSQPSPTKAKNSPTYDFYVQTNVIKIPFKDNTITGIWNVMGNRTLVKPDK